MDSLETRIPQQFEYRPPWENPPANKRKAKVIKSADRTLPEITHRIDEANLAGAKKDPWPKPINKRGNLSTPDLLEMREAEKAFRRIDPIIDEALGQPLHRTMKHKKRKPDYSISDLENAVAQRTHANPKKVQAKARQQFAQLFKPKDQNSFPEQRIN